MCNQDEDFSRYETEDRTRRLKKEGHGCPQCASLKATIGATTGTLMAGGPSIRREDGTIYIPRDPNTYTTSYRCLNCGKPYKESRKGR